MKQTRPDFANQPLDENQTGIIFDIERCSLHDGPGIRTTVFLKGCPLSCKWCHNPESQLPSPQLAFYKERCTSCGMCSGTCPDVHQISGLTHQPDRSKCHTCGKCAVSCPSGALKLIGKSLSVKNIMEILRKDTIYFQETNGGLTVSGGEPFFQPAFLKALLMAAKKEDIHTCIETSGFTSRQNQEDIMPFVDTFLFDFKVSSPQLHQSFTGVSLKPVLENFQFLYGQKKDITLRCPIIPGYNDTDEHLKAIARMEKEYPSLSGIEILPYHSLGKEKATAVNKTYEVTALTPDEGVKNTWREKLKCFGCSEKVLSSF